MNLSKLECIPAGLRPWVPLTQADLEGSILDITEASAAAPAQSEVNFETFSARS